MSGGTHPNSNTKSVAAVMLYLRQLLLSKREILKEQGIMMSAIMEQMPVAFHKLNVGFTNVKSIFVTLLGGLSRWD